MKPRGSVGCRSLYCCERAQQGLFVHCSQSTYTGTLLLTTPYWRRDEQVRTSRTKKDVCMKYGSKRSKSYQRRCELRNGPKANVHSATSNALGGYCRRKFEFCSGILFCKASCLLMSIKVASFYIPEVLTRVRASYQNKGFL